MSYLQLSDVQSLLFSGFARRPYASYLLLSVSDAERGRAWIGVVSNDVLFGTGQRDGCGAIIAFTAQGLTALGVDSSWLDSFSPAFTDGMDSPYRSRILGDSGANAPAHWAWGSSTSVHVLLACFGSADAAQRAWVDDQLQRAAHYNVNPVARIDATPLVLRGSQRRNEHFGFADGISNPSFFGDPREPDLSETERALHLVATGEFLLGWDNAYGVTTPVPRISGDVGIPMGHNGSYLVLRQLQQDVSRFWSWCDASAARIGRSADVVGAKAVGRWRNGSPLALCPGGPNAALSNANGFLYGEDDAEGDGCPFGAHIRRSNPRDSLSQDHADALRDANTHRILRRGRSYGARTADRHTPDGVDRGLVFLCLNANPERQFEFVQQSWVNNTSFAGLHGEVDPLLGDGTQAFTIPAIPLSTRLAGLSQFVTVRGGAYFFLPSRLGLQGLAETPRGAQ